MMDTFMQRAVELAQQNVRDGGTPFGAVLVKDQTIIAEGVNELHIHHDVAGHAELLAIRRAQEVLQTADLSGYTMYASGQPCPMCLASMYYVGITQIYYCSSIEEAAQAGLGTSVQLYAELAQPNEARTVVMKQIPLDHHLENPLEMWVKQDG